jgi:hypothetical protein
MFEPRVRVGVGETLIFLDDLNFEGHFGGYRVDGTSAQPL